MESCPAPIARIAPLTWFVGLIAMAPACGAGAEDPPVPGELAFADGTRIRPGATTPDPFVPGQTATVAWTHHAGRAMRGELRLVPPRVAARQEVRRSLAREPLRDDPRSSRIEVEVDDGPMEVSFEVPTDFGARTAVVLYAPRRGEHRIDAVAGPRREDGWGVLALVPVEPRPRHAIAPRSDVTVDGRLDEAAWKREGIPLVHSVSAEPAPELESRVWFAWNEEFLYLAGDLRDSDIWSTYTEQDDPLYKQEVFELFVASDAAARDYIEYEVSPRNVTFDAHFPRYRDGDEAWDSRWRTAVHVRGTLDDRDDRDEGWSVEVAVPWSELCAQTRIQCPPRSGLVLRVNVFRIDVPRRRGAVGLALSPTHVPDFHAWDNAARLELAP